MSAEQRFGRESLEARGRNVEVNIIVARHAQKQTGHNAAEDGTIAKSLLSANGRDRAHFFGQMLHHEGRDPKVIGTSYIERTKETATAMLEGAGASDRNVRGAVDLGFSHPGFVGASSHFRELYNSQVTKNRDAILEEEFSGRKLEDLTQDEQEAVMYRAEDPVVLWWLATKDTPLTEGDVTITPRGAAALSAYQYGKIYKIFDRLNDNTKEDYLVVSHQCVPEPFLAYVLLEEGEEVIDENILEPGEKIKRLGGSLAILDNFDIKMRTDEQKQKTLTIRFRGKEYQVDVVKFLELAEEGRKLYGA